MTAWQARFWYVVVELTDDDAVRELLGIDPGVYLEDSDWIEAVDNAIRASGHTWAVCGAQTDRRRGQRRTPRHRRRSDAVLAQMGRRDRRVNPERRRGT